MSRAVIVLSCLLLAACGSKPDASGASPDEARQLNEAAAALDVNTTTPDEATADTATDQGNAQ